MAARLTFTPALAKQIVDSRRIGSTVREAIAAAGVPHATALDWLKAGREWNSGISTNPRDERFAEFARDMDAARSVYLRTLRAYRANGVQKDARLAHEVIVHEEKKALRNAELRLMKARAIVEQHRAAGTHVERVAIQRPEDMSDDELRAEAQRLAAADLDDTVH